MPNFILQNKNYIYAGRVKHHNVCKSQIAIDTRFKQTEGAICGST